MQGHVVRPDAAAYWMRLRQVIWCSVAIALAAVIVPLPAAASVAPVDAASTGVADDTNWETRPHNPNHRAGMALWSWPEGDRLYQVVHTGDTSATPVVAYSASDLKEVANVKVSPPVWGRPDVNELTTANGRHLIGAVDRDNGRFFVPYAAWAADVAAGQPPCAGTSNARQADGACVGGVHILDGTTLESLGKVRLDLPTVDGVRVQPIVRAMQYAPASPDNGWSGKLLMVIEEVATGPLESSVAASLNAAVQVGTPRRNSANIAYAVQIDPDTQRQDWAVRLEGCRNSREGRSWFKAHQGHPAAIFRAGGESPAIFAGCHGNPSQQGVVVRVPLDESGTPALQPVIVGEPSDVDPGAEEPGVEGLVQAAPRQEVVPGPDKVNVIVGDPASGRMLMRVHDNGEVWWVFDAAANQFVGTIGIGSYIEGHTTHGFDPDIGRLYVLATKPTDSPAPGGLYVADVRRNPLPQALHYPELADPARSGSGMNTAGANPAAGREMSVQPRADGDASRLFSTVERDSGRVFRVILDKTLPTVDTEMGEEPVRSLDLDEAEGVTTATFDATARGFGFRAILLGGVEGATRVGPADPVGTVRGVREFDSGTTGLVEDVTSLAQGVRDTVVPPPDPCTNAQREVILAFAGPRQPAVVDASSSRGEAQPVFADVRTREEVGQPVSRCGPTAWEALWAKALVSRPPVGEPTIDWPFAEGTSSCTTTDDDTGASWNDPVLGAFSSHVECSEDEVSGWGQARGASVEGISVADTLSSFRIYRDPGRGIVARVESIARGINMGGVVRIETVRGMAESWANGRTAPEVDPTTIDPEELNPFNCDASRPAGTCFQRHVFGVRAQGPDGNGYGCGPCGDEEALIDAINRAFGAYGIARFRQPDRDLARGSEDGYIAAITKKDTERFSDIVLNADLLETMVPMLEVVRYAPHNRQESQVDPKFTTGTPPRGRQIYQFAAVEVSSTYSVQCLLVYDEATNTCAGEQQEPGAIQVSLSDSDGKPLAGGAFEVRADVDADGVLGLKDTLLPDGACVTADDGVGTCKFDALAPGSYLVGQVAAPPGYAKSAEPFVVELASGEQRTVAFTNVSNVSTIELKATDENGQPLSGAVFAAYPDPDSDGKVAPEAKPAAECTTDGQGACQMKVPAGSYVLVQTSAPGGLEGIEPVAFTFASGGQVASVSVVNYPPGAPQAPEPAAAPVTYTPPVDYSPPTETIDEGYVAPTTPVETVQEPAVSVPERIGGTVTQVIRAPGDALRLLARDPKQAIAWTAALALFVLAALAVRRRQHAMGLMQP